MRVHWPLTVLPGGSVESKLEGMTPAFGWIAADPLSFDFLEMNVTSGRQDETSAYRTLLSVSFPVY